MQKAKVRLLRSFVLAPLANAGAGKPCKHIFALLQGDITNLVSDNADEVYELRARSEGSTTLEVSALPTQIPAYSSSQFSRKDLETIEDVVSEYKEEFENLGWATNFQDEWIKKDDGTRKKVKRFALMERFKNGNPKRKPRLTLYYTPFDIEPSKNNLSELAWHELQSRSRPWSVKGKDSRSMGTWKNPYVPIVLFIEIARELGVDLVIKS